MVRMKTMAAAIAMSALTAACSGGGSESGEPATEAETVEETSATAVQADSGLPEADDIATLNGVEYSSLTGDAESGKLIFAQCRTCHVTDPGINRIGPSLAGIVGRESGSVPGYKYSEANASSDVIWTEEKLFQYLENPMRVMPKTKMIFAGLPDPQKRADLIAYLKNPN